MIQPIFDFIEKFATDFSWRRLIIFFSLVMLLGFIYFAYESITNSSQLTKYERAVQILEKSQSLKSDDPKVIVVLDNIHTGLNAITESSIATIDRGLTLKQEIKQAIAGGAVWFVMALFFVPALVRKSKDDAAPIVGGCLALSFITGLGGYFLPTTWDTWIVYGLYPVGLNLLLFIVFAYLGNKK